MAKVGYVRVSTQEQNESRQLQLMKEMGVDKVFSEKISGKNTERPELQRLLEYVREGDTIVIESYSRLARNVRDLLDIVDKLQAKGVDFISNKEQIDTSSAAGRLMLTLFAGLGAFERECMLERQREGIEIAKAQGKYKGRKPIDMPSNFKEIYTSWKDGNITAVKAMELLNIKRNTFYRMVAKYESKEAL